ncbi:MAG: hypothetical protein H6672_07690 [Anaerolineaceae bacterium]|nr:hypothetical protein [Anaerolineaceae bacterium]
MKTRWQWVTQIQNRKRFFITAVLLLAATGAALMGVLANRNFTVDHALKLLGATLPDGALDVQFSTRATPTRIFWLRFSLDSEDQAVAFWQQAGITPPQPGFTPFPQPNPYEAGMAWWQPFGETTSGSYTNTGTRIMEALVDRSGTTGVVVYLRVYSL